MVANNTCEYFKANPPLCDKTWADNVGNAYFNYEIFYIVVTTILTIVCLYYLIILVKNKGWTPFDLQRKAYYGSVIICASMIARAADPSGWRRRLPGWFVGIMFDTAATCVYAIIIWLTVDWARIILKVTGGAQYVGMLNRGANGLVGVIGVTYITFGGMQYDVDPLWAWRVTKLIIGFVVLCLVQVMLVRNGWKIYNHLHTTELKKTAAAHKREASINRKDSAAPERTLTKRSGSRISRILTLTKVCCFFMTLTMIVQASIIAASFSDQYTKSDPPKAPSGAGDVIADTMFNWVFWGCICITVYFYHYRPNDASDNSQGGASSRSISKGASTTTGSTAEMMKKQHRQNRAPSGADRV